MDLIQRLVNGHADAGRGDHVCYADPDVGEVSYAQLATAARRYAAMLRDRGVRAGTRGLVVSDDSVAAVVAVLGMWWRGCVPVPVSPALRESDIVFIARDCVAGLAHLDAPAAKEATLRGEFAAIPCLQGNEIRAALRRGTPHDPGAAGDIGQPAPLAADGEILVQYTSGSTGTPRGVRHSPRGLMAVLTGYGDILDLGPDDVVLSTAKLSFCYGFANSLLLPLAAGARAVLIRGSADPHTIAAQLRRHRPSVLFSVPRGYAGLLDLATGGTEVVLDSVRLAVSAGEHLPAELATRWAKTYAVPLINGLGATEVGQIVVATHPSRTEPGSTGHPVSGVTVTVRDDTGQALTGAADGRLHVISASVALGYLNRPEETARTFADGGVYTGDLVQRGADGELRYLCRSDDLLTLGGYKMAPTEIENALRMTTGLADCAVVTEINHDGLAHAVAYAVPHPGVNENELRRAITTTLRTHLAVFKRPTRIEVLAELPRTATGKIARARLRARTNSGAHSA